jgi:hypothetical protein
MEKWQGWLEAIGFCAMMAKVKESDPQWKFWKFRFLEGFGIAVISGLVIALAIFMFKDNFVPKTTVFENNFKRLELIIRENTVATGKQLNELSNDFNTLNNRVTRIEGKLDGWEEYNGD